jgi:hypothetical protein
MFVHLQIDAQMKASFRIDIDNTLETCFNSRKIKMIRSPLSWTCPFVSSQIKNIDMDVRLFGILSGKVRSDPLILLRCCHPPYTVKHCSKFTPYFT